MSYNNLEKLVKRYKLDRTEESEPIAETLDDVKTALVTRLDRMEANISLVLEHILNEVTALRQETSELRAQFEQQDIMNDMGALPTTSSNKFMKNNNSTHSASYFNQHNDTLLFDDNQQMDPLDSLSSDMIKFDSDRPFNISNVSGQVMPLEPFQTMEEFLQFAQEMEDNPSRVQLLVHDCFALRSNNCDKFVRNCWRKILHDHVAENFTWRGTAQKQSIREMAITRAIQAASRQMYGMEDDAFERVSRKYFQYARDRLTKIQKYHEARLNSQEANKTQ